MTKSELQIMIDEMVMESVINEMMNKYEELMTQVNNASTNIDKNLNQMRKELDDMKKRRTEFANKWGEKCKTPNDAKNVTTKMVAKQLNLDVKDDKLIPKDKSQLPIILAAGSVVALISTIIVKNMKKK